MDDKNRIAKTKRNLIRRDATLGYVGSLPTQGPDSANADLSQHSDHSSTRAPAAHVGIWAEFLAPISDFTQAQPSAGIWRVHRKMERLLASSNMRAASSEAKQISKSILSQRHVT